MLKSKAYVCNRCRKVITYSVKQAGTTGPCPFCGTTVHLPVDKDFHPAPPSINYTWRWLLLLLLLLLVGAGCYLFLKSGAKAINPQTVTSVSVIQQFMHDRITVAPAPAKARGARATIAVKEMRYGCPDVYHVALNKTLPTETPVCCVELEITNTGKKQVEFHSWRIFESYADQKRATLTDINGSPFGLVSFGIEAYPCGAWRQTGIAPGETITDMVLFISDEKPASDLNLILPCENLGGKGDLRFTIPCGMIR